MKNDVPKAYYAAPTNYKMTSETETDKKFNSKYVLTRTLKVIPRSGS